MRFLHIWDREIDFFRDIWWQLDLTIGDKWIERLVTIDDIERLVIRDIKRFPNLYTTTTDHLPKAPNAKGPGDAKLPT